jgi:hypothetical protein
MLENLLSYFKSFQDQWLWSLAFGPFTIDEIVRRYCPWLWEKRLIWKPRNRKRIEIFIIILGVFFAGFFAWQGEHETRLHAEQNKSPLHVIDNLQDQLNQANDTIEKLNNRIRKLNKAATDRSINSDQQKYLVNNLSRFSGTEVRMLYSLNSEKIQFFAEIVHVFKEAKWKVNADLGRDTLLEPFRGNSVLVGDSNIVHVEGHKDSIKITGKVGVIVGSFSCVGTLIKPIHDSALKDGEIKIYIGDKNDDKNEEEIRDTYCKKFKNK